jgi:serine/threonine protein kinase
MAAKTARTLRPEDEISRYRIVGPLGAGGMGEVYLAQDTALGRNVALKILPPEIVRSEERVRRFVLEAKSASSLSHPNIVTIHEIGQDAVKSAGEPDSAPVHYISMELVSGKTLSALIHEDRTELRTLLGYLAQAADGIAKAHAAGIVHRDLKPGNIMVTADGFAKVLDFGLAKLTESRASDPDATSDPTVAHDATGEGSVVGTAGYMSPEQVQGKGVDHRSDIFSFGCILYEAATRRRAFSAESSIETMHKVLHESPTAVEELNPKVPAELRRLVRRCLQKSPEQRLQSMKDLALELREIESEYDALSASASSGSHATSAALPKRATSLPWIVAGVVVVAAVAISWWGLRRSGHETAAFQKMRMSTQSGTGDIVAASLSADGRFLAFVSSKAGLTSLRVRQVATGSDVTIVPAGEARLANPSFSPDGNYLYFTSPSPDRQNYNALYQVPSLGGSPREITFDVDSRATFSPDGKQLAFRRHLISPVEDRLIVFDLGTRQERELGKVVDPLRMPEAPAWSPDGKQIAALVQDFGADLRSTIALFDAKSGRRREWASLDRTQLNSVAWLRGGSGLVTAGRNLSNAIFPQLVLHAYPGGRASRVTNDFNEYTDVSASLADETIAAVRTTRVSNLYLVDASGAPARRLTSATGSENSFSSPGATDTSSILCDGPRDGVAQVWSISTATGEARTLTDAEGHSFGPRAAAGVVVYDHVDSSGIHVWAMNADGSAPRQLTRGIGEQNGDLSRDGRFVVTNRYDAAQKLRVVSTSDARVQLELDHVVGGAVFSPDSRSLLVIRPEQDEKGFMINRADIVPVDGGPVSASFRLPANAVGVKWGPDGRSISYQNRSEPNSNVILQPLGGGPAVTVTRVSDGRAMLHRWSPDGNRLAILVRSGAQVDVWVTDADGGRAVQVTRISPEVVVDFAWLPDSRHLAVEAATWASDVVLVRDFR